MCGFAGLIRPEGDRVERLREHARAMATRIAHRGPDDEGTWVDADAGVALGHRRLSILDLSAHGHQPMVSSSGRWVFAYNGEIYNYRDLRSDLQAAGARFDGTSDTEVLLAAIDHWGPREALTRCNGMFAFAAWDREERQLVLARDRVGQKPLYYGWLGDTFAFASELKAFGALPEHAKRIDRDALHSYLRYKATPGSRSIYVGVHKLEPGTLGVLRRGARELACERYWSPAAGIAARGPAPEPGPLLEELDEVLSDAVSIRLESDVPLGAFLSGGVDSSLVVAHMQARAAGSVKTFSIGFHEAALDEAPHARAVADYLGTEHTELYVTAEDARAVIPSLPSIFDEPFSDVSQIPTYLVSKLAREHVTVALSGDGGDELFAGYPRYPFVERLFRPFASVPAAARLALAALTATARARPSARRFSAALGRSPLGAHFNGDRARLLENLLRLKRPIDFYRYQLSTWREDTPVVIGAAAQAVPPLYLAQGLPTGLEVPGELASFVDFLAYLPDDILVKVDRCSMAVSLEARAPLLDHRVVELAWRTPYALKTRDGGLKWPLQTLVRRHVDPIIMDRPKMGFGVPMAQWLRGPLREWAEDLLAPDRLRRDGYLAVAPVRRRWEEHLRGHRSWAHDLWGVLMFQAFLDEVRP